MSQFLPDRLLRTMKYSSMKAIRNHRNVSELNSIETRRYPSFMVFVKNQLPVLVYFGLICANRQAVRPLKF